MDVDVDVDGFVDEFVVVVATVVVVNEDDDIKLSFDPVDNLFNERSVSGKFGGVAGVFAGVMY